MMHITYGTEQQHAERLKRGLKALGPNFIATICWGCDGALWRRYEYCSICGEGRFYGSQLGLLIGNKPAPDSVVNQVLVAADVSGELPNEPKEG